MKKGNLAKLKLDGPIARKLEGLLEIKIGDLAATYSDFPDLALKKNTDLPREEWARKRLLDVFGDKGYKPLGHGTEDEPFRLQVLEKPRMRFKEIDKGVYQRVEVRPTSWPGSKTTHPIKGARRWASASARLKLN